MREVGADPCFAAYNVSSSVLCHVSMQLVVYAFSRIDISPSIILMQVHIGKDLHVNEWLCMCELYDAACFASQQYPEGYGQHPLRFYMDVCVSMCVSVY